MLCVVEAEDRPSLVRFNDELLDGRYGHGMLVDGNDLRGIDVGLFCTDAIDVLWVRSHVDVPDPAAPGRRLFSRDCPVYHLRLPGLAPSCSCWSTTSRASRSPVATRTRCAPGRAPRCGRSTTGCGPTAPSWSPSSATSTRARTATTRAGTRPWRRCSARTRRWSTPTGCDEFSQLFGDKDVDQERPGSFQSCTLQNRLDYILLSPELAATVTDGGVFRKGLWGTSDATSTRPRCGAIYPEITATRHAASDHAAVWVDLDSNAVNVLGISIDAGYVDLCRRRCALRLEITGAFAAGEPEECRTGAQRWTQSVQRDARGQDEFGDHRRGAREALR